MEIALKILTPIWTGDMDKTSTFIIENGLLGSIRWWAEAINRGFDYASCDPTNDNDRCPSRENNKFCFSCFVFGATDRRRLFRLQVEGSDSLFQQYIPIIPNIRNRGWYYPGSGVVGDIAIKIIPLNYVFKKEYIILPINIASQWGAIGAKTQLGYGVSNLSEIPDIRIDKYFNSDLEHNPIIREKIGNQNQYPNLKYFFFAKFNFKVNSSDWWKEIDGIKNNPKLKKNDFENLGKWIEHNTIPLYPAIKNWLRYGEGKNLWITDNTYQDQRIANFLLGTIKECCYNCFTTLSKDKKNRTRFWCPNCRNSLEKSKILDKIASKIHISFAYQVDLSVWEFRIWGWIPTSKNSPLKDREDFLNKLNKSLTQRSSGFNIPWERLFGAEIEEPHLTVWREYNSPRDTVRQFDDYSDYLQSLISEKETSQNG
ncbi:MAG: type III-B CRISPR module RAMP protein Cmr1 [Promethearchaeota archaeon]